ncbi:brachyurin-like [Cloeon dipterum]|uniref:brachyurin-like n=1 Tax=Cloeon dipterum TaxID=197152 RepID=UPI0032201A17
MGSFLAIVFLVLLAQAAARATNESKNEAEAQFERPAIKEYTLEELLGEDNGIAALEAANEKRNKFGEKGSETTVVKEGARILGGSSVTEGEHSYNVFVGAAPYSGNAIYCGGALLSPQWVLTAAQCVAGATEIVVFAGAVSMPQDMGILKNARATIHPGFVRNFAVNDIALLKTATPYTLSSTISTIRLSTESVGSVENAQLRTFGFGPEDNSAAIATSLNYVDMANLKKSTCLTLTTDFYVAYPANTGCLSTSVATKGWCYGDTGSPVVYTNDGDSTTKVYGVNSQYLGCSSAYPSSYTLGDTGSPVVYTNDGDSTTKVYGVNSQFLGCSSAYPSSYTLVRPYLNWIKAMTKLTLT